MACPRCRTANPPSHRFCDECGQALPTSCPRCGFAHEPGARFCGGCGQAIGTAGALDQFASPDAYTPPHLAEKIRTSRGTLEGERKQVTVLFADMKGSLELLTDRDPEDARRIMAIFGAPVAHENHAVRAVYAALRMQDGVRRLALDLRRAEGLDAQIRVGLNSGEIVVRSIGSDLHMDYTAVGQTTYLAAQMERLARPGATLLARSSRGAWRAGEGSTDRGHHAAARDGHGPLAHPGRGGAGRPVYDRRHLSPPSAPARVTPWTTRPGRTSTPRWRPFDRRYERARWRRPRCDRSCGRR